MASVFKALGKYYVIGALLLLIACGGAAPAANDNSAPVRTAMTTTNATPDEATSAAAPTTITPGTAQGGSGIEGRAVISPICPVARANQPCPPRPYQATINIMSDGNRQVAQAQADAQGQFRIALPAGTYTMVPVAPGVYPRAAQQTVTVSESGYISVTIAYDSGIR